MPFSTSRIEVLIEGGSNKNVIKYTLDVGESISDALMPDYFDGSGSLFLPGNVILLHDGTDGGGAWVEVDAKQIGDDISKVRLKTTVFNADNYGNAPDNIVSAVAGLTGSVSKTALLAAINVEDGAVDQLTGPEISALLFAQSNTNNFADSFLNKLIGIEPNATEDQSDSEIVAGYNSEVAIVSAGEITLGTGTEVRRYTPANIKALIDQHAPSGPGSTVNGSQELINVENAPYNATGDGSTDDTLAIQTAINDANEGDIVYLPNRYSVNTLTLDTTKSIVLMGDSPQKSSLIARTAEQDIILVDPGNNTAQDRFETQHFYLNLEFALLTIQNQDSADSFNRCTAAGYPVGCAGIAYEHQTLESSTNPSINDTWPNTHGLIYNCIFQDINRNTGGFGSVSNSAMVYFAGSSYGWTIECNKVHDLAHDIVIAPPFVRRVTSFSGGSNQTLNHSGGTYPNNAELTILQHTSDGTLTTGAVRYDELFAVNSASGNVQLSTSLGGSAIAFTPGTAQVYIAARDDYLAVFAPDQMYISNITHYGGKTSLQIPNPEGTKISGVWAYEVDVSVLDLRAYPGGSRETPLCTYIGTIYAESPQSNAPTADHDMAIDPLVNIEGIACHVDTIQIRGTNSGGKRPRFDVKGVGNRVDCVHLLSNLSQGQPDLVVSGDGCIVSGVRHSNATISNTGSNNKIHFVQDNGTADGANNL